MAATDYCFLREGYDWKTFRTKALVQFHLMQKYVLQNVLNSDITRKGENNSGTERVD
jgi:hypothetical protein